MPLSAILILLTLVCGALFFFPPAWFPVPIAPSAIEYDHQFTRTLWVAGAIFVVLQLLLAWTVARKRETRGAAPRWLEPAWTLAAVALFLGLALPGSRSWAKIPERSPDKETIEVYAHQFAWNFRYSGADGRFGKTAIEFISDSGGNSIGLDPKDKAGKDDIVTATLRVPVGRDVLLLLHSRDVIHDFFVRELRTKQDIVPGMEIPLEIHVDKPGQYEIACAELCGLGHSQMRSLLIAMPAAEFDEWKRSP